MNLHNSLIMRQAHTIWWRKWDTTLLKGLAWTSVKEDEHYFDLSCQEGKPPITIRKLERDWVMCQHRSHQTLNLRVSIMITHHVCYCGNQMSVSTLSLEIFQWTWSQLAFWKEEDEEMIQSDIDPWIKHLNTLWDIHFEQCEPPTEDKVVQINLGSEANPKPIFISESLSPSEKEDLIYLIREYINVFAWNYEDMPELDSQVAMHRLNINPDIKPV